MKKIYLVRHGQTLFNLRKKRQGWTDSPLTEKGIAEAKLAGKYFKKKGVIFDKAFCSTQERASDTLELMTELPYERLKDIKEWNFGEFDGMDEDLGLDRTRKPEQLSFEDWWVQFGGESVDQVAERMTRGMNYIAKNAGKNTLVICHGGAMWSYVLSKENIKSNLENFNLRNGIRNLMTLEFEIDENNELVLLKTYLPLNDNMED